MLAYLPFLAIAALAQWSDRYRSVRWWTYLSLIFLDALTGLGGLLGLVLGYSGAAQGRLAAVGLGVVPANWAAFGLVLLATALVAPALLLPPVRRGLARLIPIEPTSDIHAAALALAALAVGLNFSQLPLLGGLEAVAESTSQFGFLDLLLPLLPLGVLAIVGVGMLVRRTWRQTWQRLGVARLSWRQCGLALGLALGLLVASYGLDWLWRLLDPENRALIGAVGEVLYAGAMAPWQGLAISLATGVLEELLFRGALQPRFGFLLTALLFTAVHTQYGLTPATLEVLLAALVLGFLRRRVNTTACMVLHAAYNAGALLVFPLLP